jgi:hypothetical protein
MAFLVALSNAWYNNKLLHRGIFLVILLLGYGLIAVPKELWDSANYKLKIKYIEWQANEMNLALQEKNKELSQYICVIKS